MSTKPFARLAPLAVIALAAGALPPVHAQDASSTRQATDDTPTPARPSTGADPSQDAFEMGSPPALPDGLTEEDMWPAATAEGWKRPCLVRWQRNFEDAIRVGRAEQRPVLVAVNMDGEIASEHFAGVKYRDPETAEILSRYACVIASVYRHTPRDYDEEGRRVECPRFGTVTCGEHIEAERELYEIYFDGVRVAPRHIVLALDGSETYDVYYSWDTDSVVKTFYEGIEGWPDPVEPVEPTLFDLVASSDVDDRVRVERTYLSADRATREEILGSLAEHPEVEHVEVLRAALNGFDIELARIAQRVLARYESDAALDLMAQALNSPLAESERDLLLANVERLAETSKRAKALDRVHAGLSPKSRHLAADTLEARAREYEANAAAARDLQKIADETAARPQDPTALLELAEGLLARADESEPRFAALLAQDADAAARDAERLGAKGVRLEAVLAVTSARLGRFGEARERAADAIEGGLFGDDAPESSLSDESRVRLLWLFAQNRERAIREAFRNGADWPSEWLSDLSAAYTSIAERPLRDPAPLIEFHDFLRWIGAIPRAEAVLDEALERFPDVTGLHDRLRDRLLWSAGPSGLEQEYASRLAREAEAEASPNSQLTWFAGYASLVAAEHYRRRSQLDDAVAAYERGIGYFERNSELYPDARDLNDHYVALAHAGRARIRLERQDLPGATEELLAALALRPASAATQDGLGITPIATAKMIKARCLDAGDEANAQRVQRALDALDPALLEPAPNELQGSARGNRTGGRRNPGR